MAKGRWQILDFFRGIAIICVVLDHCFAWVNPPTPIADCKKWLIFSTGPLFFLAGITFALSFYSRLPKFITQPCRGISYLKQYSAYVGKKASKLVGAYLLAMLLITSWQENFSLSWYFHQVLTFPHQFYFISIYLQLLLVAPLISYSWVFYQHKFNFSLPQVLVWGNLVYLTMALAANTWPILAATWWRPAQLLGGGIQLWLFSLGACFTYAYLRGCLNKKKFSPALALCLGVAGIAVVKFTPINQHIFAHPPNFYTIFYLVVVFVLLWGIYQYQAASLIAKPISFLGKNSLSIFLYHSFFMEKIYQSSFFFTNHHFKWQLTILAILSTTASLLLWLGLTRVWQLGKFLLNSYQSGRYRLK